MKKSVIPVCAAALAVAAGAYAQEFGVPTELPAEAPAQVVDVPAVPAEQVAAAVAAEVQPQMVVASNGAVAQDLVDADKSAEDLVNEYFVAKVGKIYDPATGRIVVQATKRFDVRNPRVSTEFLKVRSSKMTELLIEAKAQIVQSIFSKMSAERILEIPGNPIEKQLSAIVDEVQRQAEYTGEQLEKLGIELSAAKEDMKTMSVNELMATVTQVIAETDEDNLAAKFDAEKKERYEQVKAEFERTTAEYTALMEKAEKIRRDFADNLERKSASTISRAAQMQIHGCTVIQQADSVSETGGKWTYEMSVLFSWSPEAQSAASAILGGGDVRFPPNKNGRSVVDWVNNFRANGALGDWMGPRTFVDGEGNMWYLGIAAAPVLSNANADDKSEKIAELEAAAEVVYALYADAYVEANLKKLAMDINVDGNTEQKVLEDFDYKAGESFKDIHIHGLMKVASFKTTHKSTGQQIHVVIYGVNASQAATLRDIRNGAKDLALLVNISQEIERGRTGRIQELIDASKNNAGARQLGATQVDTETAATFSALLEEAQRTNVTVPVVAPVLPAPKPYVRPEEGKLQRSSRIIFSDDDF